MIRVPDTVLEKKNKAVSINTVKKINKSLKVSPLLLLWMIWVPDTVLEKKNKAVSINTVKKINK